MPRGPGLQSYFHFYHKVFSSQLGMLICIKGPSLSVMLGCAQGCVYSGYYKEIKLEWQDSRQDKNSIQHCSLRKTGFLVEWFLFYVNKNVIEYLVDNCRVSCCCCCTFKGFKSLWSKFQELSHNGVNQKIVINIIKHCIKKLCYCFKKLNLLLDNIFYTLQCICIFCSVSLSHTCHFLSLV